MVMNNRYKDVTLAGTIKRKLQKVARGIGTGFIILLTLGAVTSPFWILGHFIAKYW